MMRRVWWRNGKELVGEEEFINRFGFEGVHNSENSGESERLVPLSR